MKVSPNIFIYNSDSPMRASDGRLVFVISFLVVLLIPAQGWTAAPSNPRLRCSPQTLYRGDTLEVQLPSDHGDLELAIWTEDLETLVIVFQPTRKDHFAPIVAPSRFEKMARIDFRTTEARGLLARPWREGGPLALKAPQTIFTKSGLYEILLDGDLGYDDADFAACWVAYLNHAKPVENGSPARRSKRQQNTQANSAIDVDTTKMTTADKRAFRRSARDSGALIVDQGHYFHVMLFPTAHSPVNPP